MGRAVFLIDLGKRDDDLPDKCAEQKRSFRRTRCSRPSTCIEYLEAERLHQRRRIEYLEEEVISVRILITASSLQGHAGKTTSDRSKLDTRFFT